MRGLERVLSRSSTILCALIMAFGGALAGYGLGGESAKASIYAGSPPGDLGGYIGFGMLVFVIGIGIIPWLQKKSPA